MKLGLTYTARSVNASPRLENGRPDDTEEEFDSPETIEAIAAALRGHGHEVERLADGPDLMRGLLSGARPDLVFNIAEGRGISRCRESWVPALLESLGIPYTGSDPLTLALALDKHTACQLVSAAGIAVPAGVLVDEKGMLTPGESMPPLPAIVKPAFEGSSRGIFDDSVVDDPDQLRDIIAERMQVYRQAILVQEFIDGDELTVGIVGNDRPEVLSVMRILPRQNEDSSLGETGPRGRPFVYSLEVKRDWRRRVRYESPATLPAPVEAAVCQAALQVYHTLGCRDVARIDFRLCDGVPYFIEANALPGLAPGVSDLVLLAEGVGIGYEQLIGRIVGAALERLEACRAVEI